MIEALGNLGDFIGGIAVVVTLIYLAQQVRQNTAALRTSSRQEIVDGMRENVQLWFQPGMAEAFDRHAILAGHALRAGGLPNLIELPLFRWPETAGVEPAAD